MQVQEIKDYCMSKLGAYEECPFGDVPICYKLNGRIFAQLYPYEYDYKITLKCTEDAGQFYRMAYPEKSGKRISLSTGTTAILEYGIFE